MEESGWSSNCRTFEVTSSSPRGRPKKTWNKVIRSYLKETKVSKDIAKNRNAWTFFIGNHPTHANMENRHLNKYDNGLTFVLFLSKMVGKCSLGLKSARLCRKLEV